MFIMDSEEGITNSKYIKRIYREDETKYYDDTQVKFINLKAQTIDGAEYLLFSFTDFKKYKKALNLLLYEIKNDTKIIDMKSLLKNVVNEDGVDIEL